MDEDFEDFVAVQTRPLLGLAHALTANPHDAWDLTQETLARLGERWHRTRIDGENKRSRFRTSRARRR